MAEVRKSGHFRTAMVRSDKIDFDNASWISGGTLLRRSLSDLQLAASPKDIANATVFASGVGCFRIQIDGENVASSFLDPGWHTCPQCGFLTVLLTSQGSFTAKGPKKYRSFTWDVQVRLSKFILQKERMLLQMYQNFSYVDEAPHIETGIYEQL